MDPKIPLYCVLFFISTQAVYISATTLPILWPVRHGTNWVSCPPLQKALSLHKTFQNIAWWECVGRCQTDDAQWDWKAGMDNKRNIHINNGLKPRYNLDRRGFLEIKNVTAADQGSEYRCTVKTDHGRESVHIILTVVSEEASQQTVTTVPMLWPVRRGTNWISCPPLQNALSLQKTFKNATWFKCAAGCQTDDSQWEWKAGMDNKLNIQTINGSKYNLDQRGLLKIGNVTEDDNGTEYRCTLKTDRAQESINIILTFVSEEGVQTAKPKSTIEGATGIPTTKKPAGASDKPTGYIVAIFVLLVLVVLCVCYIIKRKYNDYRRRNEQNPSVTQNNFNLPL